MKGSLFENLEFLMDLDNQITFHIYYWPGFKSVFYLTACTKGHQCCVHFKEHKENTGYSCGTKIQ